jgi:hypothetical protein
VCLIIEEPSLRTGPGDCHVYLIIEGAAFHMIDMFTRLPNEMSLLVGRIIVRNETSLTNSNPKKMLPHEVAVGNLGSESKYASRITLGCLALPYSTDVSFSIRESGRLWLSAR